MVGCHPGAITTHKGLAHASLRPPRASRAFMRGLFLFVRLSRVCSFCQPIMENVLHLLPHLLPKEI